MPTQIQKSESYICEEKQIKSVILFIWRFFQKNTMELEDIDFFNLIGLPTPSTDSSSNQSTSSETKEFSNFESDSTNLDR